MRAQSSTLLALSSLALALSSPTALADELLFLTDNPDDDESTLYQVTLEATCSSGAEATLTELSTVPFGRGHIAATGSGEDCDTVVAAVSRLTGELALYDVAADTWTDPVQLTLDGEVYECDPPPARWDFDTAIVSVAFSPEGELWVASGCTDTLYTVDLDTGAMTAEGQPLRSDGSVLNIGNDIAFDSAGQLTVYSSNATGIFPVTERGLYDIDTSTFAESTIGDPDLDRNATGIAHRRNGLGDFVLSESRNSRLHVVSTTDGSVQCSYDMVLDGDSFTHTFGDMATGRLDPDPGTKSIVCHKGKNTLEIGASAEAAHLAHGDTLGSCEADPVESCPSL